MTSVHDVENDTNSDITTVTTETLADTSMTDTELELHGYVMFMKGKRRGGVIFHVKKSIKVFELWLGNNATQDEAVDNMA